MTKIILVRGWVGKGCSYLNFVRVVQPQVVEPHGEATAGGVEDPHGALLRQTMCYTTLHYMEKYQIFY